MGKSKNNGTNFLVQGSILAVASIISRIIGLVYRIPLNNILGDVGISYYACAFDVYNVILIISSYSLPQAVSKTVSAKAAKGQYRSVYQVLKGALLFALVSGIVASLVVFFGAEFFTGTLLKTPYSVFALKILGPALVVVAVLGVLRGFFQGLGTMMPSAISQIIEQIVNAIISVWAAYVLYRYGTRIGAVLGDAEHYGPAYGAAGGTLGTNLGSVAALIFVLFVFFAYMHVFKRRMRREKGVKVEPFAYTMKILIITIVPVLLSTTVYNISSIIDQSIFKNVALLQGYSENKIDVWWGVFSGKYKLLINVPISIASAMAASCVPTLTMSFAQKDMKKVREQINSAMRFIMVISFPCAIGLAVLGEPICRLLFPGTAQTAPMAGTKDSGYQCSGFACRSCDRTDYTDAVFPHEYLCGHYRKYVLCVFNVYYECAGNTKIQRLSSGNSQNIYCAGNFLGYYGNYYLYRLSWQLCGLKNQCGICHACNSCSGYRICSCLTVTARTDRRGD